MREAFLKPRPRRRLPRSAPIEIGAAMALYGPNYILLVEGGAKLPSNVQGLYDTQTKAAGLPRIRLHDLRHGHAIQLRDAGVPAEVISKRLGHASVAFTIDTYMSASPPSQQDAVATLAQALGEAFLTLP